MDVSMANSIVGTKQAKQRMVFAFEYYFNAFTWA